MSRWLVWSAAVVLATVVAVGLALGPTTPQDRVEALGQGIRCPVCQAESIANSPSPTAQQMMEVVREQVAAGRSDEEVRAFFAARYGRWVLLDPGLSPQTVALWALPFVAALIGVVVVRRQLAHDGPVPEAAELASLRDRLTQLRADTEAADGE